MGRERKGEMLNVLEAGDGGGEALEPALRSV